MIVWNILGLEAFIFIIYLQFFIPIISIFINSLKESRRSTRIIHWFVQKASNFLANFLECLIWLQVKGLRSFYLCLICYQVSIIGEKYFHHDFRNSVSVTLFLRFIFQFFLIDFRNLDHLQIKKYKITSIWQFPIRLSLAQFLQNYEWLVSYVHGKS